MVPATGWRSVSKPGGRPSRRQGPGGPLERLSYHRRRLSAGRHSLSLCLGDPELALALGRRDDSLRRQGAFPGAGAVPRAGAAFRAVPLLEPQRVRRLAADRRSAIPDLLARDPARGAGALAELPRGRRLCAAASAGRRAGTADVLPRSRLASGGRAAGGDRLRLRRLGCLARAACRADREPRLLRHRAVADGQDAATFLAAVGRVRRSRRRHDGA